MDGAFYRRDTRKILLNSFFRNRRIVVGVFAGLIVALYILFGSHGIIQRVKLAQQIEELETRIKLAEEENIRLQAEVKALDSDLKTIERVAREKYFMAREGETVYRVRTSDQESATTQ